MKKSANKKYQKPTVKAQGKFKDLTQAKGGTKNDGGGKPASRINGPAN